MQGRRVTLVISRPGYPERRVPLQDAETTLGRSDENPICLPDIGVSRRHALFRWDGQRLSVEDLRSGNGTWLRGDRVNHQELVDGDELYIDPFTVRIELEALPPAPPVAPPPAPVPPIAVPAAPAPPSLAPPPAAPPVQVPSARPLSRAAPPPPAPPTPTRSADPTLRLPELPPSPPAVPGARLEVLQGEPDLDRVYPVPESGLTIGRSEQRDIILTDLAASRLHAELLLDRGVWRVRDPGSSNGVYVNGARVVDQPLRSGDHIKIGSTELRFVLSAAVEDVEDEGTERTEGFGQLMPGLAPQPPRPATGAFPQLVQRAPDPEPPGPTPLTGTAVPAPPAPVAAPPAPAPAVAHPPPAAAPAPPPGPPTWAAPQPTPPAPAAWPAPAPTGAWPPGEPALTGAWPAQQPTPPALASGAWVAVETRRPPVGLIPVLTALVLVLALGLAGWKVVHDLQTPQPLPPPRPALGAEAQAQVTAEMAEGRALMDDARYYEAAQRFIRVLRLDPGHPDAERLGYAACEEIALLELHDIARARGATPQDRAATRDRALKQGEAALKGKAELPEAEGLVRLALRMNPGDKELVSLSRRLRRKAAEQQERSAGG